MQAVRDVWLCRGSRRCRRTLRTQRQLLHEPRTALRTIRRYDEAVASACAVGYQLGHRFTTTSFYTLTTRLTPVYTCSSTTDRPDQRWQRHDVRSGRSPRLLHPSSATPARPSGTPRSDGTLAGAADVSKTSHRLVDVEDRLAGVAGTHGGAVSPPCRRAARQLVRLTNG